MTKFLSSVKKLCACPTYTRPTFKHLKIHTQFLPYHTLLSEEGKQKLLLNKQSRFVLKCPGLGYKFRLITSEEIFQIFIHGFSKKTKPKMYV